MSCPPPPVCPRAPPGIQTQKKQKKNKKTMRVLPQSSLLPRQSV